MFQVRTIQTRAFSRADLGSSIAQVHTAPAGRERIFAEHDVKCEQDGDTEELGLSHASR
jgi:hypothetical protein